MSAADAPVEFDPADFGAIPSSRSLRQWMRTTRRQHADRSFWEIFEDVYLVLFTIAMAGATGGNVVRHLNSNASGCTSRTCGQLADWMPWIAVPLLLAITLRVLLAIGPVSASRATGFWLLATPVDRAALLRPAYRLVMGSVAVLGVVVGALVWALLGASLTDVLLAAVLIGATLICAAVSAPRSLSRPRCSASRIPFSTSTNMSASFAWMSWFAPIGFPKTSRVTERSSAASRHDLAAPIAPQTIP